MLRQSIQKAQVEAMKAKDKDRLGAIRLILAKIKDRDIEMRVTPGGGSDDEMVIGVLQKMAKQRRESITMYEEGGREELAARERDELAVIEEFMPRQMDEAATRAAIEQVKADTGAQSVKDMGKVMGELKARYGAELDMSKASSLVKESLQ